MLPPIVLRDQRDVVLQVTPKVDPVIDYRSATALAAVERRVFVRVSAPIHLNQVFPGQGKDW